jgi:hypothetical protein
MLMHVHPVLASELCTGQNAECTRLHAVLWERRV